MEEKEEKDELDVDEKIDCMCLEHELYLSQCSHRDGTVFTQRGRAHDVLATIKFLRGQSRSVPRAVLVVESRLIVRARLGVVEFLKLGLRPLRPHVD